MASELLPLLHSKRSVDETYELTAQYLQDNAVVLEDINDHYWALHYVWDVIPQNISTIFRSSHTFPAMEAQSKFDSAIALALEGFYHESILCLKNCYELGLLSVFYNHDENGPSNIEAWAKGEIDTPFMRELKKGLKKVPGFIDFDVKFGLFDELDATYRTLNNYSHTRGIRHSARGIAMQSNVNHFEEKAFSEWWRVASVVAKSLVLVHTIRYPLAIKKLNLYTKFGISIPFGYFLDDGHVDMVRKVLPDDRLQFIEGLLEKDEFSQSVIKDVLDMPDMTKEDYKKQTFNHHRMSVEHDPDGYEGWFESHSKMYEQFGVDVYEKFLEEAKELKKWAEENGFMNKGDFPVNIDVGPFQRKKK